MSIQITGPRRAIEQVLSGAAIPGARLRDLHSLAWIEAPELEPGLEAFMRNAGCKVHHAGPDPTANPRA